MALVDGIFDQVKEGILTDLSLSEEPMSYQLVGGVTAHQGDDG